jgi:membrane protease YdiL (CAAX protease family)
MGPNDIPPLLNAPAPEAVQGGGVPRWRWWLHLSVLGAFPLVVGVTGLVRFHSKRAPVLPGDVSGLLTVCGVELGFFGVLFAIAWIASRADARQLMLKWRKGGMPIVWGLGYSVALRGGIAVVATVVVTIWFAIAGAHASDLASIKSHADRLVNPQAMVGDPAYLILLLTLVSFVVAGLREELWRAAMLAGIRTLFPRRFAALHGRVLAVLAVALIFGLGHTAQGFAGVLITALLGAGLGGIMLWHRSIWEAVFAHGFFDASSFALLYAIAKFSPGLLPHG